MQTFEEQKQEFLEHAGVKGMRWGHRKADSKTTSKKPKKKLTPEQKQLRKAGIILGIYGGARLVSEGARFIRDNPKLFTERVSKIPQSRALTLGYDVVKLKLKNGVWG